MSDMQRTLTYMGIALLAVIVAWEPWRPAPQNVDESEEDVKLFNDFTDPLAAKSLEIVKYDEATSTLEPPFKVAQHNGVWSIPSHSNYPADAHDHMAKAAASLMDLEALGKVSDNSGDRELYGVVDPDPKTLRAGAVGVGMRVTLRDIKDEVLADLIIGKTVKDQPDLRYVRKAGHDQIYKVALNPSALSTKFEDWIEKDLLKLKTMDVKAVDLNDYSTTVSSVQGGGIAIDPNPRSRVKLAFDDDKSKWSLLDSTEYKDRKPIAKPLVDGEELNSDKLNGLKTALSDLKIVDVQPKPKGLSTDLRATQEFAKDAEGINSLASRGFYPVQLEDDKVELYSSDGEVVCGLKDGVEYVLRFGNVSGAGSKEDEKDDGKKEDSSATQLNRFIFVMAQLNKELIAKPELEPLPGEEKADDAKKDEKKADDDAAKKSQPEETKAKDADKTDAGKPGGSKSATAKDEKAKDPKAKTDKAKTDKAKTEKPKPNASKSDKATPAADKAKDEKAAKEKSPDEKAKDEKAKDDTAKDDKAADSKQARAKHAEDEAAEEEKARQLDEKRNTIQKQNKRKQAEYDDRVAQGEKRVKELNDRFADWYYVIPDSVYRNIHLSRADIVKVKDKAAGHKHDEHDHDESDEKLPDFNSLPKLPQE